MILHMLCLLMVMMMFSSVISAPGQIHTMKDMPLARKDEPRPKSSGTLDPLGGGHLLKADSPDIAEHNFRSLDLFVSYQDDIPQEMVLVASEDKQKPSSSGTLDPIGGGNLVRVIDPEADTEVFQSLVSLLDNQNVILQSVIQLPLEDQSNYLSPNLDPLGGGNFVKNADPGAETEITKSLESHLENKDDVLQNVVQLAREDKPKELAPNLDPIGGGNLVRNVDSDAGTEVTSSLESHLENQDDTLQSTVSLSRKEKQKSGTLDSLGGGNIVRIVEPEGEAEFYRSLALLFNNQDSILQKLISVFREDKQKSSSSGTLDPLGGGNLVRIVDPEAETGVFNSLESLIDNEGRQNMMRLAREDKSMQRSSHALDGLGGGHLVDPYKGQIFRSLDHSHLVDTVDQGGDVQRMLDSLTASDLLSLDSAERMAVLNALRSTHTKYPKRMLDSVSGWAFGESKRNFDEIDNVGFTGFAKRGYPKYKNLALAKKNFDEIDRAGFETYNKRDFDEIDRTGFDTFEKRDRKE